MRRSTHSIEEVFTYARAYDKSYQVTETPFVVKASAQHRFRIQAVHPIIEEKERVGNNCSVSEDPTCIRACKDRPREQWSEPCLPRFVAELEDVCRLTKPRDPVCFDSI